MTKEDKEFNALETSVSLYIEDPWERVKFIFTKNDHGEMHPDLLTAINTGQVGFLVGTVIGGAIHQKKYLAEIKERSDAKMYCSIKDAYKQMSQESLKGFLKGAFKWGPRLGIFAGSFMLFATCVETYRNKPGILEHSFSGFIIGGLLRSNLGIRGILVGSLIGGVLGTVYGVTYFGICKVMQMDKAQVKYAQYALSKYINEKRAAQVMEKKARESGIVVSDLNYLNPMNALPEEKDEQQ